MSEPSGVPPGPMPGIPPRPPGLRGFLMGPRLVNHKGFWFLLTIFILVAIVFSVAFYEFTVTLQPLPTAPVEFAPAYMVAGNGTFNVSSDGNASWAWQNFTVNLTINNFGAVAVPLAASGANASFLIGSTTTKAWYHVVWWDKDHNGRVSTGDAFTVTGDHAALPGLSYVKVTLTWMDGVWHQDEYFVTSETIV